MHDSIKFDVLRKALLEALEEVALEFVEHPANFLYESEVQATLLVAVRRNLRKLGFDEIAIYARDYVAKLNRSGFNVVRSEYPSTTRFDIALIQGPMCKDDTLWNQLPRIGVELKLWQIDESGGGIRQDIDKLDKFREDQRNGTEFTGLSVLFVHPGLKMSKWIDDTRLKRESLTLPENETVAYLVQAGEKRNDLRWQRYRP